MSEQPPLYDVSTCKGHVQAILQRGDALGIAAVDAGKLTGDKASVARLHHRYEAIRDALLVIAGDIDKLERAEPDGPSDK